MTEPSTTEATAQRTLAALWERARVSADERVVRLEQLAQTALAAGLDEPGREEAERLAHQLAGSLGTFGMPRGTEMARALEHLLATPPESVASRLRMAELTAGLRVLLDHDGPVLADEAEDVQTTGGGVLVLTGSGYSLGPLGEGLLARGHRVRAMSAAHPATHASVRSTPPALVVVDLDSWDDAARVLVGGVLAGSPATVVAGVFGGSTTVDRVALVRAGIRVLVDRDRPDAEILDSLEELLRRDRGVRGRVLAVDDDPLMLVVLETVLRAAGLEMTGLSDPALLWDELETTAPDLVMLDMNLPGVSGSELCRAIRMDPRFTTLPVLFLTGAGDQATIAEVFAAGADDFVRKPVVGPELVTRINNRLERARLVRERFETDVVTGVTSRMKAEEELLRVMSAARRHGTPLVVALLDLDRFKTVNDRFGHATGDEVLRRFGAALRAAVRVEDVVARWGGEEFLVALSDCTAEGATTRLTTFLEQWRATELQAVDGTVFTSSFSAGVAQAPDDGGDVTAVCRSADEALYRAKNAGRAQVLAAE